MKMRYRALFFSLCVTLIIVLIIVSTSWHLTLEKLTYMARPTYSYNDTSSRELSLKVSNFYYVVDDRDGQGASRYTTTDTLNTTYPPKPSSELYKKQKEVQLVYFNNPESSSAQKLNFEGCEYSACAMTSDLENADVVIIDGRVLRDSKLPRRYPGQIWLMNSGETPVALAFDYLKRSDLIDQFNWTKTVHNDSTFLTMYGHLTPKRTLPQKNYSEKVSEKKSIYRGKIYDVAWFVSHCNTPAKREEYVRRMTSEIDVHIFGTCGNLTCGDKINRDSRDCLDMLSQKYKFYLSFENSFCQDYVTEKFFNMFKGPGVDIVPVVRNGVDHHSRYPPGISVISSDFSSPESLGKYLYSLARDEKRYIELLKTKDKYTTGRHPFNFSCDLCKALHLRQPVNIYHHIVDWLRRPEMCWPPTDL